MPRVMLQSLNESTTVMAIGTSTTPMNSSSAGALSRYGARLLMWGAYRHVFRAPRQAQRRPFPRRHVAGVLAHDDERAGRRFDLIEPVRALEHARAHRAGKSGVSAVEHEGNLLRSYRRACLAGRNARGKRPAG